MSFTQNNKPEETPTIKEQPVESAEETTVEIGKEDESSNQEPETVTGRFATEQIEVLEQSRAELQAKANEYLDGWQRSRADFANYKKRIEREQAEIYQRTAGSILKRHLEVIDDLERALRNRPAEGDGASWSEGIDLVYRKLTSILESEGVKAMQTEGQMFDPNFHEAISSEESPNHKNGEIIEAVQRGYLLGDKVLRPALVRVAR
jgi:molecular chaperone GrpE